MKILSWILFHLNLQVIPIDSLDYEITERYSVQWTSAYTDRWHHGRVLKKDVDTDRKAILIFNEFYLNGDTENITKRLIQTTTIVRTVNT